MAHIIDATETKDYVAKDGDGPAACLEFEGNFDLLIKSIKRNEKLAESGNTTVNAVFVVLDDDFEGAKGAIVYHSFPITGKVASGASAGRLNITTLIDLCLSAGRQDLADMIIGKKFDVDGLLTALVGDGKSTHCYARVIQQEDDRNNRVKSVPSYYLTKGKAKYEESKQTGGVGFRSRPRTVAKKGVGAPVNASSNGVSAGTGVVATDQLSSEV